MKRIQPVTRPFCKTALACALAFGIAFQADHAHAYVLPVIDAPALNLRITNMIKQYAEWVKTGVHYGKEIQHFIETKNFWQSQLVKLKALRLELFGIAQTYEKVDPDYGVEEQCPGALSGNIAKDLIKGTVSALSKSIGADGNLEDRQNGICVAITRAENKKYNFTVEYFDQLDRQTAELVALEESRLKDVDDSMGNMAALAGDTARYQAAVAQAKSIWEANVSQQDTEIGMLKKQQAIFARRLLYGKPSLVSTLVSTAVLKAALSKGK